MREMADGIDAEVRAVGELRKLAARVLPVEPAGGECEYCRKGVPLGWLDADGTLSHLSGRPSTLCHSVGDSWWPCERVVRPVKEPQTSQDGDAEADERYAVEEPQESKK
jgi:hypothetical protein